MYEQIKIQLFINVVKSLEEMKQGKFTVEGNLIKGEKYSIEIAEDNNRVNLAVEGYKTGYTFYYNDPWFVVNKDTDSTIRELLEGYERLTLEKIKEVNDGIKSILMNRYEPESVISNDSLDNTLLSNTYYIAEGIKLNIIVFDFGEVQMSIDIDNKRVFNLLTMNIKEFTPVIFVSNILPMFDGLIGIFKR